MGNMAPFRLANPIVSNQFVFRSIFDWGVVGMNISTIFGVGSKISIEHKVALLLKQGGLMKEIALKLLDPVEDDRMRRLRGILFLYLAPAVESVQSVILLVQNDKYRDAYVTGRTIFLCLVNACFTSGKGPSAGERALRYS